MRREGGGGAEGAAAGEGVVMAVAEVVHVVAAAVLPLRSQYCILVSSLHMPYLHVHICR